jgi:hypothetical protein
MSDEWKILHESSRSTVKNEKSPTGIILESHTIMLEVHITESPKQFSDSPLRPFTPERETRTEYVTHLMVYPTDGEPFKADGHYFADFDVAEIDYKKRCEKEQLDPRLKSVQ